MHLHPKQNKPDQHHNSHAFLPLSLLLALFHSHYHSMNSSPDTITNTNISNSCSGGCYCGDEYASTLLDLSCQNEFFKAQFEAVKGLGLESGDGVVGESEMAVLHERIEELNKEVEERKEMQSAAERALMHLREEFSEADARAKDLEAQLAQAEKKMEQEIKERDSKYSELDLKLGRLHKRAKQRIQDVQKEKEDMEARLREVNEMAERGSSQQASLQQELDRTRQQANEALRALDVERQQLRTANNKLRDTLEEEHRLLAAKGNAFEELQHSLFEKEQMLEEARQLLQTAEEQKQASFLELSSKQQMHVESLEAQLADALSDRSKAAQTISSLQVLLAVKESETAEMDAVLTGETVRLKAAMESAKGEVIQMTLQHEKEKEAWESAYQALRTKLEVAEGTFQHLETETEKLRSQLELELSMKIQLLNAKDAELSASKEEINRIQREFSAYKVRAHALFQKKDAELAAAKDSDLLKAQEETLKEAEKEVALAYTEREMALQDLKEAYANHDKELSERDATMNSMEQHLRMLEIKLESVYSNQRLERESWQRDLESIEETWRMRCEALEAPNDVSASEALQRELEELKLRFIKLKEEHDSFRDIADRMIEEKDKEISRLSDDNKNLNQSLSRKPSVQQNGNHNSNFQKQQQQNSSTNAAEQQILVLARQQAQREEQLAHSQRHILALQEEIEELERENRLHSQQEAMLKEELRKMERMEKREGVDMTYLKNVVLKLLETGEVEALLPVIGMLLQFSPDEIQKCQQAYHSLTDVPPSPASDAAPSGASLFSRFSF